MPDARVDAELPFQPIEDGLEMLFADAANDHLPCVASIRALHRRSSALSRSSDAPTSARHPRA
jgi:hypothetical protein